MSNTLADVFAGLDNFSAKVKNDVVYVGAQAAAEVFYLEAKINAPISNKGHWFHGTQFKVDGTKYWFEARTLQNSIYQVNSKDNSGNGKATYHVAWNHKKCPYGFMVEFGTRNKPGVGFMRRSYMDAKDDALMSAKGAISEYLAAHK